MNIIIEIQKSNDGTLAILPPQVLEKNLAEQAYHSALAAAAVSSVDVHTVAMLDDVGAVVKRETYYHGQVTE